MALGLTLFKNRGKRFIEKLQNALFESSLAP
jgi:hypothetical protein